MKFVTHNARDISVYGTSLCGQLKGITYDELVERFGDPLEGDECKIDAEWNLEFEDEDGEAVVATIYNWKSGKAYLGDEGLELSEMREWNIGGKSAKAAVMIGKVLGMGAHEVL